MFLSNRMLNLPHAHKTRAIHEGSGTALGAATLGASGSIENAGTLARIPRANVGAGEAGSAGFAQTNCVNHCVFEFLLTHKEPSQWTQQCRELFTALPVDGNVIGVALCCKGWGKKQGQEKEDKHLFGMCDEFRVSGGIAIKCHYSIISSNVSHEQLNHFLLFCSALRCRNETHALQCGPSIGIFSRCAIGLTR